MNPLIVLEKKYIERYGINGAMIIAFLKEKGGVYVGSAKKIANEMGVISNVWITRHVYNLIKSNVISAEKVEGNLRRYTLLIDMGFTCDNSKVVVEEDDKPVRKAKKPKNDRPKKELPANIKDLVDKIENAKKEKRLKEICES